MPATAISRRHFSPEYSSLAIPSSDTSMKDTTPLLNFEDSIQFDPEPSEDPMIFNLDMEEGNQFSAQPSFTWEPSSNIDSQYSLSTASSTLFNFPSNNLTDSSSFNQSSFSSFSDVHSSPSLGYDDSNFYMGMGGWLNEPESPHLATLSSPIPIPSAIGNEQQHQAVYNLADRSYPQDASFSPAEFATIRPLPRSYSPPSGYEDNASVRVDSVSPQEMSLRTPPSWAAQLWDTPSYSLESSRKHRPSIYQSRTEISPLRPRAPVRRDPAPSAQIWPSSSAPSVQGRAPGLARGFSRRADSSVSVSVSDDRDATVRRRKRAPTITEPNSAEPAAESIPSKSLLRPPKLAPSAWQLYFTDWIQRQQASNTRKLNVAQAAKEAGQEYAGLSLEEKEPYKRRSQTAKEARERELNAYMRTLTPEDIKRENAFRAAQRKAGKSRKSNIKDPNAPKKPLSAYFMFLQRIRSDPAMVADVFGDETETTKQSVLAAAKWRSMTDDERKPFLAQAEQEKLDYEAARRLYEEGTVGIGSSINFSILPGSPAETAFRASRMIKIDSSESESDGFITDDYSERVARS